MIEVFKTNIHTEEQAELILSAIRSLHRNCKSNFDLEDIDRILRIETKRNRLDVTQIIKTIEGNGFLAEVLC